MRREIQKVLGLHIPFSLRIFLLHYFSDLVLSMLFINLCTAAAFVSILLEDIYYSNEGGLVGKSYVYIINEQIISNKQIQTGP